MASGALGAIVATRFRARPRNLRNAENSPGLSAGKRARGERRRDARSRGNLAQTTHIAPTMPTFHIAGIETTLKRSCWVVGLTGSPSWTARGRAWSSWAMSPSTSMGRSTRSSATILRAARTRSGGDTTTDSNIRVSHRPPMANRGRDRPSRASLPRCPNRDPWRLFTPRAPQEESVWKLTVPPSPSFNHRRRSHRPGAAVWGVLHDNLR